MNTLKLNPSVKLAKEETAKKPYSIYQRFNDFAEGQNEKRAAWYLISILGPGVLILPVPAALIYYYNAPAWTVAITVTLFFASVVVGMGGSNIRVLIALLGLNIIVHLLMIAIFVL